MYEPLTWSITHALTERKPTEHACNSTMSVSKGHATAKGRPQKHVRRSLLVQLTLVTSLSYLTCWKEVVLKLTADQIA